MLKELYRNFKILLKICKIKINFYNIIMTNTKNSHNDR